MSGNNGVRIHIPWIVPEVIAQEIVDDLEAALEQIRLITNDYFGTPRTLRI